MQYDTAMQETRLTTADELFAMGRKFCELIHGEVVEVTPGGGSHSRLGITLASRILVFTEARELGTVFGADTGFLLKRDPDTVRCPDVAFVATGRLDGIDETRFLPFAPDLAVEVVSPSDRFREVEAKAAMWLSFGSRLVWVVEPDLRKVFIYRKDSPREELTETDDLTCEDLLPGLTIPLANIF